MTKNILLLAALGLALSAIGAQAQEYNSADASTTVESTNEAGDRITTYTSYSLSEYDGKIKETAFITVSTDYAPVCDHTFWTWSKRPSTSVSFYKDADWKSPAVVRPQLNHDGMAYNSPTRSNPVVAQASVTVIDGALTPEQARRLVNGE
jgi:hypothetical protein